MSTPSVSGPRWMTESFGRLGPRAFRAIALPGSHDAGMSTLLARTLGTNACNTVTQSGDVLAQLNGGSRYFDLRPTTWDVLEGFSLGHFSKLLLNEYVGGTGQPLADALRQVSHFLQQPGATQEVVILKFGHFLRLDRQPSSLLPAVAGGDFDAPAFERLVSTVLNEIGPSLITSTSASISLNDATLSELASGQGRVVAAFDLGGGFPPALVDPSRGIFSYNNLGNGPANLVVYDSYADVDQFDVMVKDQETKFLQFEPASASSFLLSWTLTKTNPFCRACIQDLATAANADLLATLQLWTDRGIITPSKIPNVIYVDYIQDPSPALQGGVYLNDLGA